MIRLSVIKHVTSCGDDVSLIMTPGHGIGSELTHSFAWDTFQTEVYDLFEENRICFECPADLYDMLMFIGAPTGEVLEPFAFPFTVGGGTRSSHHAPFMPVSVGHAHPARFADPSFDEVRHQADLAMDHLSRLPTSRAGRRVEG